MQYYRRRWSESRGDHLNHWGPATYLFETFEGSVRRQIELYDSGHRLQYDADHPEDDAGSLASGPVFDRIADAEQFRIESSDFEREWLPRFPFHPQPVRSEALVREDFTCSICNRGRHYRYQAGVYTRQSTIGIEMCPFCIHDGSAAVRLEAEFNTPDDSPPSGALEQVIKRTPGFLGWQDERWLVHCDRPAQFLDRVGRAELVDLPPQATDAVRAALRDWGRTDDEREQFFEWLHRDGNMTGYLFRCTACDDYLAYADAN